MIISIAQADAALNDKLVRLLFLVARLVATGNIAPDIFRLAGTARLAAFAAAIRMVNWVHSFTANRRPDAEPTRAAGFAERNQIPFGIRNLAKRCEASPTATRRTSPDANFKSV